MGVAYAPALSRTVQQLFKMSLVVPPCNSLPECSKIKFVKMRLGFNNAGLCQFTILDCVNLLFLNGQSTKVLSQKPVFR